MINKDIIAKLDPCKDRYDNFVKFYGDRQLTKAQFMGLKNITQSDKMWVAFRLMSKKYLHLAATDIAESVLHIFEDAYPDDKRPRLAIEAARSGNKDNAYAAGAAADAADAAYAAAATHAAFSAASSAYYAAYAAGAAADAAYYAYTHAATHAYANAAHATHAASHATAPNDKLIRKIVLKYWNKRS